MNLVDMPHLDPSLCIVCEMKPPEVKWIDTLYNFECGIPTPITGRKYLCEVCVQDAARCLEYINKKELDEQSEKLQFTEREFASFKANLSKVVESIGTMQTPEPLVNPPKSRGRPRKPIDE